MMICEETLLPELHCGVNDEDNGVLWGDFALRSAPQNEPYSNEWKLTVLVIWTYSILYELYTFTISAN